MYCKFFGLDKPPFNNTPDPRFFFQTPQHEEALASLRYTAEQRKGFVLVTGEVGSGKTLLGRLVTHQLGRRARTATIASSALSPHELMATLCHELEVDLEPGDSKTQLIQKLQDYLLDKYGKDRLVTVLLDEAQNLPLDSFEELRMLGNFEADDAKLLQVMILAQPEILDVLHRPDMKQLQQRIIRTVHLSRLSLDETGGYVRHRLVVAGADESLKFTDDAIEAIHKHSGGLPRMINQLCDQALLTAYSQSSRTVRASVVQEVVDGLGSLHVQAVAETHGVPGAALGQRAGWADRPDVSQGIARPQYAAPQTAPRDAGYGVDEAGYRLCRLDREAERIVEEARHQVDKLRRSMAEDLDERVARARKELDVLRTQADDIVQTATRKTDELRELCAAVRATSDELAAQRDAAGKQCDALAAQNAEADKFTSIIQDARQAVALLAQAHKNADVHTMQLQKQMKGAQELIRHVPALIDQIQAATTEARTTANQLDSQFKGMKRQFDGQMATMKERYDGQMTAMTENLHRSQTQLGACQAQLGDMTSLLSRADNILSALGALGRAASVVPKAPAVSHSGHVHSTPSSTHVGTPDVPGTRGPDPVRAAAGRRSRSDADSAEELPPLIEFDSRRAAMAQRIANAGSRWARRSSRPEPSPAKLG